jgi:phosphate transport system substrate-binding protein
MKNMPLAGLMILAALFVLVAAMGFPTSLPAAAQQDATPSPTPLPTPFPTLAPVGDLAIIAADYPRVDGSTSTLPLQRLVACKILGASCVWVEGIFGPERWIAQILAAGEPISPELDVLNTLHHTGTHESYLNLIGGAVDLILVAREPSDDELSLAETEGVALDARPVALDAFVFLVHADNPIPTLSLDAIRGIYTGALTRWSELGIDEPLGDDPGNAIHAYLRNPNSGSQELMEALVMQGRAMIEAPDMILESMIGPINAISTDVAGIGYSVYYYATAINPDESVRLLAIEDVPPESGTIAERRYPLTAEVYAVLRADTPADSTAALLRDWLLGAEGQRTVAQSGYVPLPAE